MLCSFVESGHNRQDARSVSAAPVNVDRSPKIMFVSKLYFILIELYLFCSFLQFDTTIYWTPNRYAKQTSTISHQRHSDTGSSIHQSTHSSGPRPVCKTDFPAFRVKLHSLHFMYRTHICIYIERRERQYTICG